MPSKVARAAQATMLVISLLLSSSAILPSPGAGHKEPEADIFSRYSVNAVTMDGAIDAAEWSGASEVDLSSVPMNGVDAYMLVQNNGTMLFIAYDVVGDTTNGENDSAALSFDGDHNGAPTQSGDGVYTIKASNDSNCAPYVTRRCHYVYSSASVGWIPEDAMDQGLPSHGGLWAEVGFGTSSRLSMAHRMYEFSIPIASLGLPNVVVKAGDTVGFYGGSQVSPYAGIRDADTADTSSWPAKGFYYVNDYGHLHIAAQSGVAVTSDYSYEPATSSTPATHKLTLTNMGRNVDRFDIEATSPLGWGVSILNGTGAVLTDSGGDPSLPDTVPLMPGTQTVIIAQVTPLGSSSPGESDSTTIKVKPWSSPGAYSSVIVRSAVPFTAPWTDSLDSGAQGWYPVPRQVNDWALGTPDPLFVAGPSAAHGAPDCWGTNLTGNYSLSSFSILESPQIQIPDYVASASLSFWHWYSIPADYRDGAWVEGSVDGGNWVLLLPDAPYPSLRFGGMPAYAGSSAGWVPASFNLTALKGRVVAFRFMLWDWLPDGVSAGWYIDDISLLVSMPPAGVRIAPTSAFFVGTKLASLEVGISVQNVGISTDVFDLTFSDILGWAPRFLNDSGALLVDSDGDTFPDTGQVVSGRAFNVTLNVTIPPTAGVGEIDSITAVFRSSVDISISASGQYRFQVAVPIPYMDRIEGGMAGWTPEAGGMWHQVDSCSPSPPPWFISYSPCHSWWYGQDIKGTYDTGSRTYGNLTSPPILVTGVSQALLRFRYWYETETSSGYDQRWVMVRADNDPWPSKLDPRATQMPSMFMKTWLEFSLNLSSYIGHIVQVRFLFDSVDGQSNDHQGWYVDDVNVSDYTPGLLAPSIALTNPRAGEKLTAAVPQDISWQASDDLDVPAQLRVWVNYSGTGSSPWSPIPSAQGVQGTATPVSWTPPCVNATTAALNATAIDSFGLSSWTGPVGIELDCGRPSIINHMPRSPPEVSVKANVSVTFSETMNTTATVAAFSITAVPGWVPVAGTLSWVGNTLFFRPLTDLDAATTYQVNVSSQAKDFSSPGNNLQPPFSWQFSTSSHSDSAPTITIEYPLGGEDLSGSTSARHLFKAVRWTVVDDFDSQEELKVWVNYTTDAGLSTTPIGGSQPFNGTAGASTFTWEVPCVDTINASVSVSAVDTGGRTNTTSTPLFKIDCSPPRIVSHYPSGLVVPPGENVTILFNESMNQALTQAAFGMWQLPAWTPVAGVFSWTTNLMSFDPVSDLDRGSQYQVNLSALSSDDSDPGNNLLNGISWQFTVAAAPPPMVDITNPANGTIGVPLTTTSVTITFTADVYVFAGAINITPRVNFTMRSVGMAILISIREPLLPDVWYLVRLNATMILDSHGNRLDGNKDGVGGDDYLFWFTTSTGAGGGGGFPTWALVIPLVAIGFVVPFFILLRLSRKEEEKQPEKRKPRREKDPYEGTLGPGDRIESEAEHIEEQTIGSDERPPF